MAPAVPDSDALIVGGGLVGSTLALALAREGLSVALVEPGGAGPDGRSYALSAGSRRMLAALGLWGRLAPDAQPILRIAVADGRPGEAPSALALAFDGGEVEEGPMGHMVEDLYLRPALADALAAEPRVTRLTGTVAAQAAGPAEAVATMADGGRLAARVLLACDGARGATRGRAGIGRMAWGYGQAAVTVTVSHARPHGGVAHQVFWPEGPLAVLPLRGDRASIVWSMADARARALMALGEAGFVAALGPALGPLLGDLALAGPRAAHPLGLALAREMTGPRLALVGDAAHAVHPLAGQGLNAGLKDVAALAEVLGDARARGEDLGAPDVLDRYVRWRRFDVAALAFATDGLSRLFSNDLGPLRLARDLGLAAAGRIAPLRRLLAREAAGLTGDLPRLMR